MILTTLADLPRYSYLGPSFAEAIEWARGADWGAIPEGRHAIDGDRLFVIFETVTPKPLGPDTVWEAHRRYADIQCLIEGDERFGWAPRTERLTVRSPYDPTTDKELYDALATGGKLFDFHAGEAILCFPEDTHAPCVAGGDSLQPVKRAVFKVRLD